MATYLCAVCGKLALNTNSVFPDGRIIHRACVPPRVAGPRHAGHCGDDLCAGECVGEPGDYAPHDYGDPLQDREPMGGDPHWRQDP